MKVIKRFFFFTIKELKSKVKYRNFKPTKKYFIFKNITYFSQWESQKLVSKIINRHISAKDDPLWKSSGAKNKQEYEFWSWNMCGMACLKMILNHKFNKNFPIIELGKRCQKYNGYIAKSQTINGLYYKPFIRFIQKEFGMSARMISPMTTEDIVNELDKENYVIASVSHEIRNPNIKVSYKGGHLVLVVGYNFINKKVFYIHNPSGTNKKTQQYAQISFADFGKVFAYRGIVIHNSA